MGAGSHGDCSRDLVWYPNDLREAREGGGEGGNADDPFIITSSRERLAALAVAELVRVRCARSRRRWRDHDETRSVFREIARRMPQIWAYGVEDIEP